MKGLQKLIDFFHFFFTGENPPAGVPPSPPTPPVPEAPPAPPEPAVEKNLFTVATESSVARQYEQAARTAFRQGHYEEAIEWATQSLRLDPENLMAYYYLGSAYLEQGHLNEGLAVFEKAREQGDPLGLVEGWLQAARQHQAESDPLPAEAEETPE